MSADKLSISTLCALLWLPGCDAAEPDTSTPVARVAEAQTPGADDAADPTDEDWRARAAAKAAVARRDHAEAFELGMQIEPRPTRAGFLRFSTSAIADEAVGAAFLDRLASGREPEEVRAALVEALPRTGVEHVDALRNLFDEETSVDVRRAIVTAMTRNDHAAGLQVVALGLADAQPQVRAEAARVAGVREDAAAVGAELAAALDDADAAVRAAAARSIGVASLADHTEAVAELHRDEAPAVRLETLRAIRRLDETLAREIASNLVEDDDIAVRHAAERTLRGGADQLHQRP